MKITDSLLLARAKLRARRVRSVLTALAAGFMLVVLISGSFFTASLTQAVDQRAQRSDKYMAIGPNSEELPSGATEKLLSYALPARVQGIDGKAAFRYDFDEYLSLESIRFLEGELFTDYIADGQSIEAVAENEIPIIVSTDYVVYAKDIELRESMPPEERVATIQAAQQEFLGRTIELSFLPNAPQEVDNGVVEFATAPSLDSLNLIKIPARVVGFAPSASSLFVSSSLHYMPFSYVDSPLLTGVVSDSIDQIKSQDFTEAVYVFNDAKSRQAYIDECAQIAFCQYYNDPVATITSYVDDFKGFIRYVVVVLAIIVAASMFVTVSKIISDNERETGVFRAIGARRADIVNIYFTYATMLSLLAFALAFLLSLGVMLYFSARFGNSFAYQITEFTGNYSQTGGVLLIGFNIIELAVIALIGIASAILGAIIPVLRAVYRDPIKAMRTD